ncbi:uncharacterized protein LOC119667009 [Teleopsis dalmanni]|uniref:uncharacterized protein LOC119667009 n=1 Tax=Teleopsis dalmanni TaxID=139649 RepID=UPI0018CD9458|nr:uncharacterized protein LOC119667009 [Teleopsis dalmanni]
MYKFKKNFKNVMKKRMRGTYYNYACGFPENNTAVVFCNTENDLWKNDGGILFEYEIENVVIEDSIINFRDFHKDLAEKLQLNSINTDYDCVPDFNIKNINYIVDMKLLHASGPLKHFMPTKYQCFYRDIVGYEKKTKIVFCMTDTGTTIQYVRNNENMFDVSEESGNKEKNIRDYLYICNDLIENYKKAYEASLIYELKELTRVLNLTLLLKQIALYFPEQSMLNKFFDIPASNFSITQSSNKKAVVTLPM